MNIKLSSRLVLIGLLGLSLLLAACDGDDSSSDGNNDSSSNGSDPVVSSTSEEHPQRPEGLQTAEVERVIDGDTIELAGNSRVRLIGINTPEEGEYLYEAASAFTREMLQGKEVGLEPGAELIDQFDRELFYIWIDDNLANYEIVRAGYANAYSVPPNVQYEVYFERAAVLSLAEGRGIWRKGQENLSIDLVVANPPGPDEEDMNGEFVRIANTGTDRIDMNGFTLRDDGANVYTFTDFSLEPGQTVTVYSGCGNVNQARHYWCADQPVWNNSGDTAYLNDAHGLYVDQYKIGGR